MFIFYCRLQQSLKQLLSKVSMGNTHDTEIARIEADYIHTKWRTTEDYRWGYSSDRGK